MFPFHLFYFSAYVHMQTSGLVDWAECYSKRAALANRNVDILSFSVSAGSATLSFHTSTGTGKQKYDIKCC